MGPHGTFEVLFELAQGGMGTVHLARALGAPAAASGFERLVAIKRLHRHLLGDAEAVGRFLEEAKVAARVHHANVVSIHQVGTDEDGLFIVQDYVEGDTLEALVDAATMRRERLPPPVVLRIAIDALSGLEAVHAATDVEGRPLGILHRDISPSNVLVGRDGVARLVDFGIAKHARSAVVTEAHALQGKVLYMPPEYLRREAIDARFDVYGVGVTLFTALTGEPPWADASEAQIVHLATTAGVPRLGASGLSIAPALEALVARAVERDREARFPSARALRGAIEELGRHTGWIASHAEVADAVERLVGRDLAERRAVIARTFRRADGASAAGGAAEPPTPAAEPRSRLGVGLALGAAVVLVAAVAGLAALRGPQASLPAAPAASPDGASPTPVVAPVASAVAAAPVDPVASVPPPASAPLAPGRTAPRAPPKASAASSGAAPASAPAVPAAPSAITTANPYR